MYGNSKHLFDLWAQKEGILDKITGLKYFNVYGPNEYHKGDMRSFVVKAFEQINSTGRVRLFKSYNENGYPVLKQLVKKAIDKILPTPKIKAEEWPSFARLMVTSQTGRTIFHALSYLPEKRGAKVDIVEEAIVLQNMKIS